MSKTMAAVIILICFTLLIDPVSAQMTYDPVTTYQPGPVNGSWEISLVYGRTTDGSYAELDSENVTMIFSEIPDCLFFSPDGIGWMQWWAAGKTVYGRWTEKDAGIMLTGNNTRGYKTYGELYEPDLVPGYVMEFHYDEEQNVLHHYRQDDDPQSEYSEWDFVYRRIANGARHSRLGYPS